MINNRPVFGRRERLWKFWIRITDVWNQPAPGFNPAIDMVFLDGITVTKFRDDLQTIVVYNICFWSDRAIVRILDSYNGRVESARARLACSCWRCMAASRCHHTLRSDSNEFQRKLPPLARPSLRPRSLATTPSRDLVAVNSQIWPAEKLQSPCRLTHSALVARSNPDSAQRRPSKMSVGATGEKNGHPNVIGENTLTWISTSVPFPPNCVGVGGVKIEQHIYSAY